MGDIYLSDFIPKSELIVEEHSVSTPRFSVIDCHAHFGAMLLGDDYHMKYDTGEVVERLRQEGIKRIVNLDGAWGEELGKMMDKLKPHNDFVVTYGSLDVSKLDEPDFERYAVKTLRESKEKGIKGLKFWKNISLVLKDISGKHIPIDDSRLDVIWQTAAELKLPVLIHIADPIAFFKPINRFNERYEELGEHPDWSFCSPELFTFEQLMEMQKNLIRKNKETTFVVAHAGSCAENLGFVAEYLDSFPNMYIDIAERISELGRQPYTARRFFNRYQDRIIFGTDATPLKTNYPINYRFLETWDEYFDYSESEIPPQGRWKIYGIGLEDEVLEKVYFKNAQRVLGL